IRSRSRRTTSPPSRGRRDRSGDRRDARDREYRKQLQHDQRRTQHRSRRLSHLHERPWRGLESRELRESGLALLADIRTQEELDAFREAPELTIVDVYTEDCVICRKIEPIVAAVAQTSRGVRARKIDAEALPEFADQYEVRGVPTLLLFRNGRAIDR